MLTSLSCVFDEMFIEVPKFHKTFLHKNFKFLLAEHSILKMFDSVLKRLSQ